MQCLIKKFIKNKGDNDHSYNSIFTYILVSNSNRHVSVLHDLEQGIIPTLSFNGVNHRNCQEGTTNEISSCTTKGDRVDISDFCSEKEVRVVAIILSKHFGLTRVDCEPFIIYEMLEVLIEQSGGEAVSIAIDGTLEASQPVQAHRVRARHRQEDFDAHFAQVN